MTKRVEVYYVWHQSTHSDQGAEAEVSGDCTGAHVCVCLCACVVCQYVIVILSVVKSPARILRMTNLQLLHSWYEAQQCID